MRASIHHSDHSPGADQAVAFEQQACSPLQPGVALDAVRNSGRLSSNEDLFTSH